MAIIASGIGSGLDINNLVSQLMTLESRPLQVLDQKEARLQARISAYGSVKSALSTFRTAMQGLEQPARYNTLTSRVSDPGILSVTTTSSATAAEYNIEVQQLARAQKLISTPITALTDTIGTGTLTLRFGTDDNGSFTVDPDVAATTIMINSGNNTPAGIRDAINASGADVKATLINDGAGYRLVLSGTRTGAISSMQISVDDDDGTDQNAAGLSRLAYDPAGTSGNGKNLVQTIAAADALLTVDGISGIRREQNRITDLIEGATLQLLGESEPGVDTRVTVENDIGAIRSAANDFATAYNQLTSTLGSLTAYNASTGQASILQGDASTLNMLARVRSLINSSLQTTNTVFGSLSDIGLSIQRDGSMKLDETRLQAAVARDRNGISAVFTDTGRSQDALINYLGASTETREGSYLLNISQLATHGRLEGITTSALQEFVNGTFDVPVTIDASNDNLTLKVDGIESGSISIAQGSYTTPQALAKAIEVAINKDTALAKASAKVAVTFDSTSDALRIESLRYGSASTVAVTAVDSASGTTLGLALATGVAGLDVQGSIGGNSAAGSGRTLRSTGGNANGLLVEVTGGATGDRGQVSYSKGYASTLARLMQQMLDENGPVASRTSGLQDSVENIERQREALNNRLIATETRIRAQFTALDSLMARLRSTSDFIGQQLQNLPTFNDN